MIAMPVVEDLDRPERRKLVDADGVPLARFVHETRDGREVADLFELEVPVERALPAILAELRGMRVAGSEPLGRALVAAGGTPARHAHVYSHSLRERPTPRLPAGLRFAAADRPAVDLLPAYLSSHSPEHVDAAVIVGEDSRAHLARILSGELGRPLAGSALVIDADDRVVAAILVNELADTDPPFGGPWVMELFRAPGARGAGRALLERALAVTEGTLGLAVTHGNPAERLYVALGFERVLTAFSVDL
jgi:GNAT superfamily N-acetyltransferase